MNNKDFTIGVLTVTATVLLTAVLVLSVLAPKPVQAYAQLDQGHGFTMLTVQVSDSLELLSVINQPAGLMNIYRYDLGATRLLPVQQTPLPPVAPTPTPGGRPAAR